jgi:hypothetical protein
MSSTRFSIKDCGDNKQNECYAVLSANSRNLGLCFGHIFIEEDLSRLPCLFALFIKFWYSQVEMRLNASDLIHTANMSYFVIFRLFKVLTNPTGGRIFMHAC